jgi:SAM-dependent methyltransferase
LLLLGLIKAVATWGEEVALNIRTAVPRHSVPEQSGRVLFQDNKEYASLNYWHTRKILHLVGPGPEDVVFDLGSGAGRLICMAARWPVKKCVGVEISEDYCRIARQNALRMRGRKAPIEIVCGDAAQVDLSTGTVFYLFNPFGKETLAAVLANIEASMHHNPRRVRVVYANPVHQNVLATCGWLTKFHEFDSLRGWHVSFWRNEDGPGLHAKDAATAQPARS